MEHWESEIDRRIREHFEEIDANKLPGVGKPLQLDVNPYEPPEMRLANKLLKDNDLPPSWIIESKAIDIDRSAIVKQIGNITSQTSQSHRASLSAQIKALNNRILSFNLTVPTGIKHKQLIKWD